jgi:phage gpG-like protein
LKVLRGTVSSQLAGTLRCTDLVEWRSWWAEPAERWRTNRWCQLHRRRQGGNGAARCIRCLPYIPRSSVSVAGHRSCRRDSRGQGTVQDATAEELALAEESLNRARRRSWCVEAAIHLRMPARWTGSLRNQLGPCRRRLPAGGKASLPRWKWEWKHPRRYRHTEPTQTSDRLRRSLTRRARRLRQLVGPLVEEAGALHRWRPLAQYARSYLSTTVRRHYLQRVQVGWHSSSRKDVRF